MFRPTVKYAVSESILARFLSWPVLHKLLYLAGDLMAITLAHMFAVRIVGHFLRVPASVLNPFEYHRFYIPFFAVVLYLFDGYKSPELRRPEQELGRSCKAVAVSFLGLVLFNFVAFRSESFSRYLVVSWFGLALALLLIVRFILRAIYGALWGAGLCRRRALLLGSAAGLAEYEELLSIQRHRGYEVVGVLVDSAEKSSPPRAIASLPMLGPAHQWEEVLSSTGANLLIVAYPAVPGGAEWLGRILHVCKQLHVDVELYSCVLATANLSYDHDEFSGSFRFFAKPKWSLTLQRAVKRGIDIIMGLIGSIVTVLLTPFVWMMVNLEDRGPVFYRREFVSSDGKIRYYLKFRTMLKDADSILRQDSQLQARFVHQYKLKDDPRLLRVGRIMRRYSLDEFPQFFSVLSGKLTLVGPRVISGDERQRYGPNLSKLLSCRPGLTGFWQVMGRQTTTYEERVRMDMFYVERWSIWLDFVIIAKTFWKVVKTEGAY
ncbi:MAG TPA: exopolysaccharide biosynthesis polyprenyl glycosylphosphotransferase [Candidatus Polarisedimenticolia bacterium]|nr:exopolysaccharide biosynthesis polyprenyl glycosylphosphotransferase [Candidatus Polarisedimenticolia bacterium]